MAPIMMLSGHAVSQLDGIFVFIEQMADDEGE
jgi:hypothetical protein